MDKIHDSVAWYQKKIGLHDKQLWEHSVDRKVLTGIRNAPRRSVRAKTELIDVDLIRGSTFTRAKPQVSWTYIVHKAISRVIFFPFHYKWWLQQTTPVVFGCLLGLYTAQVLTTIFFCQNAVDIIEQNEITMSEVFVPTFLMFLLGYIHSQTVLSHSHVSHRSHRDIKSMREYQARKQRTEQRKKSLNSSPTHGNEKSLDIDRKSPNLERRPKRSAKSKDSLGKSGKSGNLESKSVSWSDTYHDDSSGKITRKQESIESDTTTDDEGSKSVIKGSNLSSDRKYENRSRETITDGKSCIQKRIGEWTKERNKNRLCLDIPHVPSSIESTSSSAEPRCSGRESPLKVLGDINETCNVDILSSDSALVKGSDVLSSDCLKIPNDTEGTILLVDDQGGKQDILQRQNLEIQNQAKILESKSEQEPSSQLNDGSLGKSALNADSKVTKDLNSIIEKEGCDSSPLLDKGSDLSSLVQKRDTLNFPSLSLDKESESSSIERNGDPINIVRHVENLSEDSGIDFNRGQKLKPKLLQVPNIKPLKEPMSDTDAEQNGTLSESESQLKANSAVLKQGLRRRSHVVADESSESGPTYWSKRSLPRKQQGDISSSDGETSQASSHKMVISSEEWEDRVHSDDTTSTYSSTSESEVEIRDNPDREPPVAVTNNSSSANQTSGDIHVINLLQPSLHLKPASSPTSSSGLGGHHHAPPDKVSCVIWEKGECQKVDLTALELGWTIIEKVDNIPESSDYIWIGLSFSLLLSVAPVLFRLYHVKEFPPLEIQDILSKVWCYIMHNPWRINLIMVNGIFQRFCLSSVFFFLLSVADRTFKQRLLYAKHFCYLTSSRRARKFDMPHFRLNKVRNIRIWLSVRSYLKKRGPQRSVDVIVSASFLITIVTITLMCLQLLKDTDSYLDYLYNWELLLWSMSLGVYLFRFLTLGLKINKKYRNLSVLITEQINLYLQMEQKPHKKEELMVANNVLKLAEDLLKELESPFKVSGITANPVIYNITRVVVLSAFSAVLTELLGFKLKLYKIKLKA